MSRRHPSCPRRERCRLTKVWGVLSPTGVFFGVQGCHRDRLHAIGGTLVTHPRPARGIRRRLTPRPDHRRTSSITHGTPEARSDAAVSPADIPAPSPESDQTVPDLRPRRDVTRLAPTHSAGEAAASDTCHADVPGSGVASPLLYTAEQAAALLQVRPSWLRRKAAARTVPCRFLGKHLRFSRADIEMITESSAAPSRRLS